MRRPAFPARALLAATATVVLALATAAPPSLEAQTRTLSWTETTRLEIPGTLGMVMRMFGGSDPIVSRSALHLQGRAMIQDHDQTTFVTDLEGGGWMTVDHEARTYTMMTFDEMAQLSEQAIESVYAATRSAPEASGVQASREELRQAMEEAQAEIQFRVSAETTGQRQRIGSTDATQHIITTQFEATAVPEGVEQREGGSIYLLAELWQTSDVPTEQTFHEEWARALAADPRFRDMATDLQAAAEESGAALSASLAAWDPQIGAGLAQTADAMKDIQGTTVRSVVVIAAAPLGVTFDRAELLAWEPASMGGQLRGAAAGAARQAAADAARGAIRGLGRGMLGGAREPAPEPEPAAAAPTVQPLVRITTTREDISYRESNEDVLGALNARIAGYRQTTFEDLSRQIR